MDNEDWIDLIEKHSTPEKIKSAKKEKATGEWTPTQKKESPIKYYPKVQRSLDLHGFTVDESKVEIDRFLKNAQLSQIKTVQIITGRGWHSPNFKAVLPEVTEKKLAELKRKDIVRHFKKEKSGGSFMVYLVS